MGDSSRQQELTLLYARGDMIGYGRLGLYLADTLEARGVTVWDSDGHATGDRLNGDRTFRQAPTPTNVMCLVSTPTHFDGWYDGQYRTILTMWESSRLPEDFRDRMHEFDLVMVPSRQNLELFSRYHDNVQLIYLGVDPDLWHYIEPTPPSTFFNFLIAGNGNRKGVDLAYRAFRETFGDRTYAGPVPRLIMKSLKGHNDYWAPNVQHHTGRLSPIAERDLYASAHCYLQPSRGEGFGLQPLQALALGRPTILTGAHGHESYADLGIPLASTPSQSDYFIYGDAGMWWEPDFDQLCAAMWETYKFYDRACAKAKQAAAVVAHEFTWGNTADRFLDLLGDQMREPYTGRAAWREPERRRYAIVTKRDWYGEVAGRQLRFEAGHTYYDLADIKRILFDAGVLANECLTDDDNGLAPVQVAQLEGVRADNEYCPTCYQRLNSGVLRSDEIFEELERAANAGVATL